MKKVLILMIICTINCFNPIFSAVRWDPKSITALNEMAGKWLITISVGLNAPKESTLALRNTLVDTFSAAIGGFYQHSIDIDDKNASNGNPTRSKIITLLENLKSEIAHFKKEHPGKKTMIVFGLTGHGIKNERGEFRFFVENGSFSGRELVEMINSLKVSETVMVIQSCHSGSLVNNHFSNQFTTDLANDMTKYMDLMETGLSVITPVSKFLVSSYNTWEEEILGKSFTLTAADRNNDDIITYEEWRNFLLQLACQHPSYVPKEVLINHLPHPSPLIGLDPQIFDPTMPSDLPFLLTVEGTRKYKNGESLVPVHSYTSEQMRAETRTICAKEKEFFKHLLNSSLYTVLDVVQKGNPKEKMKALHHLTNYHKYSYILGNVLYNVLRTSTNEVVKTKIISLLGQKGPIEGSNNYFDQLIRYISSLYSRESLAIQTEIIKFLGTIRSLTSFNLLLKIAKNTGFQTITRKYAIRGLGSLQNEEALNVLINILKHDVNNELKAEAAQSLGNLGDKKAIPQLISSLSNEKNEYIRGFCAFSLGKLKSQEAIPILQEITKNETSSFVRLMALRALSLILQV